MDGEAAGLRAGFGDGPRQPMRNDGSFFERVFGVCSPAGRGVGRC